MLLVFSSIAFAFNVIPHVGQYLVCDWRFFFYLHFHFVNCACLDFVKRSGNFEFSSGCAAAHCLF